MAAEPEASLPHIAACISMGRLALLSENKIKVLPLPVEYLVWLATCVQIDKDRLGGAGSHPVQVTRYNAGAPGLPHRWEGAKFMQQYMCSMWGGGHPCVTKALLKHVCVCR